MCTPVPNIYHSEKQQKLVIFEINKHQNPPNQQTPKQNTWRSYLPLAYQCSLSTESIYGGRFFFIREYLVIPDDKTCW